MQYLEDGMLFIIGVFLLVILGNIIYDHFANAEHDAIENHWE